MNIKSLAFGSAAALLAASGAHAADAVMAPEPEPAEYVKVCDAYGAGFFYIPGTETCLSINGYVWFQVGAGSGTSVADGGNDTPGYYGNDTDGWNASTRVRINLDARSDTELGTLRGWIRLQATWNTKDNDPDGPFANGDGPVGIDQAWVQLGGLAVGYGESAWFYQFNNDTLNYGSFTWGGLYYGDQERNQVRYEFGGKTGLFGLISLEDPTDEQSYMPDVVGRIGYGEAWGAVALTGAYDHDRTGLPVGGDAGWALQGSALFNIPGMPGSALKIIGTYNGSDSNYGPGSPLHDAGLLGQPEWSVLASFLYQATPDLGLIASGQYFGDGYAIGTDDTVNGTSAWAAELEGVWTPVKNFEVRPTIAYTKAEHLDGSVSGFLRFTRYF
jgi:hypothetical protein